MKGPGSGARALLMVRHETMIRYDADVFEAHSEVRKTPIDTGLQRVLTTSLHIAPDARVKSHRDYFGNRVHHFDLLEPHDRLVVTGEAVVETTDGVCCGPESAPDPRPPTERFAEYLHASPAVPLLDVYDTVPHRMGPDLAEHPFLDGLLELAINFNERFRYDTEATDVHSSPAALFEQGGGVCQDFAHAMIGVLRRTGVPARYASGYIYDAAEDGRGVGLVGSAASHAWVQAWHVDLGWVGVDATNRRLVDWQYIRLAVGRDYLDVQPLRGVFVGNARQELAVGVSVSRLDGAAPADGPFEPRG